MKRCSYSFFRKTDFLILVILAVFCIALWWIPIRNQGAYAVIFVDNTVCAEISLRTDRDDFAVEGADGFLFRIQDGKIVVVSAPCHNKICIHSGAIGSAGQSIVCLPCRLRVTVVADDKMPDAVI